MSIHLMRQGLLKANGAGGGGGGGTIFLPSAGILDANDSNDGLSFRQVVTLSANMLGQLRIKFQAANSGGLNVAHAAFGKSLDATSDPDTTATPLELKFGGNSGFSLASGGNIWSDWLDVSSLSISSGQNGMVIFDVLSGQPGNQRIRAGNSNVTMQYRVGVETWNVASVGVGTFSTANTSCYCIEEIQTQ